MDTVNNALLDCLCYALVDRATDYYLPAGDMFNVLYMTGCRREELVSWNLWSVIDANTIALDPLKGNTQRTFTQDEVPNFWWTAVQSNTQPYEGFKITKVNYYIKKLQLMALETDGKFLLSNQFRHNYAKKLYYAGLTYEEIRVKMGENTLSVVQGYINDTIYTQSNYFTELSFTSTQAELITNNSNYFIGLSDSNDLLINYGDNSTPFYSQYQSGDLIYLDYHTFQSPFGSTVSKQVSFFVSNVHSISALRVTNNYFEGELPSSIRTIPNITYLELLNQEFTDISNLKIDSNSLVSTRLFNFMNTSSSVSEFSIPSQYFSNQFTYFEFSQVNFYLNDPLTNLLLLENNTTLNRLELYDMDYNTFDFDFSNLTNLNRLLIRDSQLVSDSIPDTIDTLPSLTNFTCRSSGMDNYTNCENFTTLVRVYFMNSSNLPTTIPAFFANNLSLYIVSYEQSLRTVARIDSWINNFYTFITSNATIDNSQPYFRNMQIRLKSLNAIPSGTYQEPSGYVQGSSNGSPASPQEKVWVLVNQYGHNVDLPS